MFSFFKRDPAKKLTKEINALHEQAVALQRNGKLREYGAAMQRIEALENELEALQEV